MSGAGAPAPKLNPADTAGLKVAVIAASWHTQIMDGLLDGARRAAADAGVRAGTALRLPPRAWVVGVWMPSVLPYIGVRTAGVRGKPAVAFRSRDRDRRRSALTVVAVVGVGAPRRTRSAHSLLANAAFSGT